MMKSMSLLRGLGRWPLMTSSFTRGHHRAMSSQTSRIIIKEDYEVVSPFPDVAPSKTDMCHQLLDSAQRFSHHTAVECGITGLSYTYGELLDRVLRWAAFLQGLGVGKGDIVAIFMPNNPHYPLAQVGSMTAGAAITCVNAGFTASEVRYQLEDSGAKLLVVDPLFEGVAEKAISGLVKPPSVFVTGPSAFGKPNFLDIIEDKNIPFINVPEYAEEDMCVLLYSSGTTGPPKGAIFKHGIVSCHIPMMLHPQICPNYLATDENQDVVVGLMPFFHAYGLYAILLSNLLLGSKIVTLPKFLPESFIATHKKHKVGVWHLVPTILQFLVAHPLVTSDDLASMRIANCSAAPCPADGAHALKNKAPNPIFFQELFGMTETMPTNYTPLKGVEKIGSCGPLLPNVRAKVLDLYTGTAVAPGEVGELCFKSPALMSGYHGRPEATAEIYTDDGWMRTGDVAKYDEDGYFYIVDRIKELIKVKGQQVSPSELENILLQHPGVADVGIVGVEDARAGELPRAYVVQRNPDLTEEEVVAYLEEKVAPHKQLKGGVKFVQELPKNPTGKLLRKVLKQWSTQD